MGILFVEYRIGENQLEEYLKWARGKREAFGFELVEGSDQPGLFVEIWRPMSWERARELMDIRLDPAQEEWAPLHGFVEGGAEKIHIWHFKKVE